MVVKASRKLSGGKGRLGGATTIRLTPQDRANVKAIQEAGWALGASGAIRFALKFTAERIAA